MTEAITKALQGIFVYVLMGGICMGFIRGLQDKPVTLTDVVLWIIILPRDAGGFIREQELQNQKWNQWQYPRYYEERR